jgi:polysaccharide pyruvyl transferase WcaK-like protein
MRRASKLAYGQYAATKLVARATHFARVRMPRQASVVFIGGYQGENTGDWAMGEALLSGAVDGGIAARRLAMRDAPRLRDMGCASLVIGGGAVATSDAMAPIAAAWSQAHFPVTLVGVDFAANLHEFDTTTREMCKQATSIGLRHKNQFDRVLKWSRNPNTYVHADCAFALPSQLPQKRKSNRVALNVLPLFHILNGRVFQPGSQLEAFYRSQNSPLGEKIETIAEGYIEFITESVKRLIADGYEIVHLPFAPEDDMFARAILPRQVTFKTFTRDLARLEQTISSAAFFLPTRFHALVAGIRTLTPLVPLAYSGKSENLLTEFGVERANIIDRTALTAGIASLSTVTISEGSRLAAAQSAVGAVARAVTEANKAYIG